MTVRSTNQKLNLSDTFHLQYCTLWSETLPGCAAGKTRGKLMDVINYVIINEIINIVIINVQLFCPRWPDSGALLRRRGSDRRRRGVRSSGSKGA